MLNLVLCGTEEGAKILGSLRKRVASSTTKHKHDDSAEAISPKLDWRRPRGCLSILDKRALYRIVMRRHRERCGRPEISIPSTECTLDPRDLRPIPAPRSESFHQPARAGRPKDKTAIVAEFSVGAQKKPLHPAWDRMRKTRREASTQSQDVSEGKRTKLLICMQEFQQQIQRIRTTSIESAALSPVRVAPNNNNGK